MSHLPLWKLVDCGCGKPSSYAARHHVYDKDKSLYLEELVDAALDAATLVAARLDAVEHQLDELIAVLDGPLSPTESIKRLRQLREGIK